jgi:hypothetical protein
VKCKADGLVIKPTVFVCWPIEARHQGQYQGSPSGLVFGAPTQSRECVDETRGSHTVRTFDIPTASVNRRKTLVIDILSREAYPALDSANGRMKLVKLLIRGGFSRRLPHNQECVRRADGHPSAGNLVMRRAISSDVNESRISTFAYRSASGRRLVGKSLPNLPVSLLHSDLGTRKT